MVLRSSAAYLSTPAEQPGNGGLRKRVMMRACRGEGASRASCTKCVTRSQGMQLHGVARCHISFSMLNEAQERAYQGSRSVSDSLPSMDRGPPKITQSNCVAARVMSCPGGAVPSYTVLAIAIVVGVSLLPIAIGYFSSSLTRAIIWAVLLGILAMLCASLRLWWFGIPDPVGRLPNDPDLQFELGQVTLIVALVYACLAAFGFSVSKKFK